MARIYEEISKSTAQSGGKTDANLANDANNLGGIPAEQYATQKYVKDYHNTKEAIQKEYIDKQDQEVLEQSKEFTNSQIRNQDFSGFAKIVDVQALDKKLSGELSEQASSQKAYTDEEIQKVVNDTNTNFQDVQNAIGTLNNNQKELFQSVSNGKATVAAAITDKGVTTAGDATFNTMATNIRNIQSGSESMAPGYVNTSDATATASDILLGKTAYAQGDKVYGTLIPPTENGMPTYGLDTSDATATENDVAYGKSFYARGQKIMGTMINNEVEEIYGLEVDELNYKKLTCMIKDPLTQETISSGTLNFSKDMNFCVRGVTINGIKYIESYPVNENGLYIIGNTNVSNEISYKKYRYTYAELGISEDETLDSIEFSIPGVDGDMKKCYLFIATYKTTDTKIYYYIYIKTYHLRENGTIGKEYENEHVIDLKKEYYSCNTSSRGGSGKIITANLNFNTFFIALAPPWLGDISYMLTKGKIFNNSIIIDTPIIVGSTESAGGTSKTLTITQDDKYIYHALNSYNKTIFVRLDEDNNIVEKKINVENISFNTYNCTNDYFLSAINPSITDGVFNFGIWNYINNTPSTTIRNWIKKFNLVVSNTDTISNAYVIKAYEIGNGIVVIYAKQIQNNTRVICLNNYNKTVETISEGEVIYPTKEIVTDVYITSTHTSEGETFNSEDFQKIFFGKGTSLGSLKTIIDTANIIGVKYKGKIFYNTSSRQLTAGQSDVRAGKTFIGWMGYPETGTMEVTE